MKKPISKIIILLLIAFQITGCFEIREEVNMKADGSGEIIVVFNLSKSKGKLKQYMKMDKVENMRVPSETEIEAMILQAKNTLRSIAGITYAESKSDWSNFIFSLTARFENVNALNEAITILSQRMKHADMPIFTPANFEFKSGKFERLFDYTVQPDAFYKLPAMQRHMLETSDMVSIYRFEQEITEYSHEKALVSPSGKAIMLKLPISDLATGRETLENSITFGKD